jgi:hypothetical protein
VDADHGGSHHLDGADHGVGIGVQQVAIGQGAIAALDLDGLAGVEHELRVGRIGQDLMMARGRRALGPGEMLVLARLQHPRPRVG